MPGSGNYRIGYGLMGVTLAAYLILAAGYAVVLPVDISRCQ